MTGEPRVCSYALDASDTIVGYGGDWLDFARANGAPELEHIVGHCVWEYVAGRTTRELYTTLFQRVRARQARLALPFRCDSPDTFRFMELEIAPGDEGALHVRGRLLREQRRPHFSVLDRMFPRSESTLRMCSVCKRAQIPGIEWMEAEDAVRRLDLFDSREAPGLEYAVCDACLLAVRDPDGAAAA